MAFPARTRCAVCTHPRFLHNGDHVEGVKTACCWRTEDTRMCTCPSWADPHEKAKATE